MVKAVVDAVCPIMPMQPLFKLAFSSTFDPSPISGLREALPKVRTDPGVCGQRGHKRDPERGRLHFRDGEALYHRHRGSTAAQTGTLPHIHVHNSAGPDEFLFLLCIHCVLNVPLGRVVEKVEWAGDKKLKQA